MLGLLAAGAVGASNAATPAATPEEQADAAAWQALRAGAIAVFRHAQAPGVGDPPQFKLGDCSTQRNLDDTGRQQAREIGQRFRSRGVAVGLVIASQWCRARDTAELAFPGQVQSDTALNSFFGNADTQPAQTAALRARLLAWRGPGALVAVSHQVNISALTGLSSASGDGVVLQRVGDALRVVGTIR